MFSAMQFDTIEVHVDGERGQLILNRPEHLNPLSSHTLDEIDAAARWFDTFRRRTASARGPDGSTTLHRYNDYRLPGHMGGGVVTVRLHTTDDDVKRKFNRAENVRQIPPGDPDFEVLYRRRNDSESINRHLDDTLWLRRAHSVGHRRQLLNLITYALGVNGLTMHVHRHGLAPPVAA